MRCEARRTKQEQGTTQLATWTSRQCGLHVGRCGDSTTAVRASGASKNEAMGATRKGEMNCNLRKHPEVDWTFRVTKSMESDKANSLFVCWLTNVWDAKTRFRAEVGACNKIQLHTRKDKAGQVNFLQSAKCAVRLVPSNLNVA